MKRSLFALALVPLISCGPTTPDFGNLMQGFFTGQFTETTVHQGATTVTCTDTYTLSGTITFLVNEANGSTLDGEGKVTAVQTHVSTDGAGCTNGPDRSTNGGWSANLAGTPSQTTWSVQRTTTAPFALTTRFSFAGTSSTKNASGVLTFTQTGSGVDAAGAPTTSSAQVSINVTLQGG